MTENLILLIQNPISWFTVSLIFLSCLTIYTIKQIFFNTRSKRKRMLVRSYKDYINSQYDIFFDGVQKFETNMHENMEDRAKTMRQNSPVPDEIRNKAIVKNQSTGTPPAPASTP